MRRAHIALPLFSLAFELRAAIAIWSQPQRAILAFLRSFLGAF
jgi:hypothetical protein